MICPLMSRRICTKGAYDQDITEMSYENCEEGHCAWWTKMDGCAILSLAEATKGLLVAEASKK